MRVKEFLIFIIIFTICYIIFFIIYDKVVSKNNSNRLYKYVSSLIDINKYLSFARCYGINGTVDKDKIIKIYNDIKNKDKIIISDTAKSNNISINEFIVIIVYLEYLKIISQKNIYLEGNIINTINSRDSMITQKYLEFFNNKCNLGDITNKMGRNSINDIYYINSNYLVPGVRLIDSNIIYVEDYL